MSRPDELIPDALRQLAEQAAPPAPMAAIARRRGRRRRQGAMAAAVAAAAAAIAAVVLPAAIGSVSHGPHTASLPGPGPSPAPLAAQLVLPSRTMTAGSTMKARVVIDNRTGHVINASGCGSLFQVLLVSKTYHPVVSWTLCLQHFTIPTGKSSYQTTILASYNQCERIQNHGTGRACLPGGHVPPLPAGNYHATLFWTGIRIPAPPAIAVRVIPPARAG